MNTPLLKIKNIVIEYHSDGNIVHAVNDVDLQINKGETLGLVGETGAGKTTLAKSIIHILPERQSKYAGGSIEFEGENIMEFTEKQLRKVRGKKISMIFQDPMTALNPMHTVGHQIAEALKLHENLTNKQASHRAREMLEMIGIVGERHGDYPHQLSGGMKQRVVIAIALACRPMLLLADEPTTALDVTIQAQVLEMINDLKKKLNTSVLFITHDLGVVAETCDRVAVMYAGEIVESGTTPEVFDHKCHPYTQGLFQSIPTLDKTDHRLKPIKGMMPNPTDLPAGCVFVDRCTFADERCRSEKPESRLLNGSHFVKCHKQGETSDGTIA